MASAQTPDEKSLLALEALEEEDTFVAGPPAARRIVTGRRVLAVVVIVAAVAALAGYGHRTHGRQEINGDEIVGLRMQPYLGLQTCYGYTGGTCATSGCEANRSATCTSRKCICIAGCSGPDGKCYQGAQNLEVKGEFTLTNVKYFKYAMYMQSASVFSQLKVTKAYSWRNAGKDKFTLFKLPGATNITTTKFFLGSDRWPGSVARVGLTTGTAMSSHGFYATGLDEAQSPATLAVSVCYNSAKNALMIANMDKSYWAYLQHGTWLVFAYHGSATSVGEGGMWTTSPALTSSEISQLPTC